MRLRSVWISEYKNLKDFSITFEGDDFLDIFVGKNGSGKSNFFEALVEIFDHIYDFDPDEAGPGFDYTISFEIDGALTSVRWVDVELTINGGAGRRTIGQTPLPDHLLIYYSGQNPQIGASSDRYDERFQGKIDGPDFAGSPRFIPVTRRVQDLYLAMMFVLPEDAPARQALIERLSIKGLSPDLRLTLQRPSYAKRNPAQFNIDDLQGHKFWRARGPTREFLERLENCQHQAPAGAPIRPEGYLAADDQYILYIDINLLRNEFANEGYCALFRQFYSLRLLGMLVSLSAEVELESGFMGRSTGFSDGQFQMVYLLASAELFKDRNVISLFDEPDAFLHPEWQFDFLDQIDAISKEAARTDHFLLSTHSASTIAAKSECRVRLFQEGPEGIEIVKPEKTTIIESLSAGLITFSESEVSLSIEHILVNSVGPILFTEGVSDALILRTAWERLFPGLARPFAIESAFGAAYLRKMLQETDFFALHSDRKIFGLFDFDTAYNEWRNIGAEIENDPAKCLARKRADGDWFALLLPVDPGISISAQILKPNGNGHFAHKSKLDIELMFVDVPGLEDHFEIDPSEPYHCIRFVGNKARFAKEVIPTLNAENFGSFRPIFDFIQNKLECVDC